MQRSAIIFLSVAVILGFITVMLTRNYLSNQARQMVAAEPDKVVKTTKVVVATVPMQFGTELTSQNLTLADWPADLVPDGSFQSKEDILDGERRVVLSSISRKEPLLKDKISGFGARASLSQVIEEGHRAVALRVNDVTSGGGFILPGDHVDVLVTYKAGKDPLSSITNIIIENVRVLAIDQTANETTESALVGKSATLELTPDQAQKVALAGTIGSLTLALRRLETQDQSTTETTRTIRVADLKPDGAATKPARVKTVARTRRVETEVIPQPINPYGDMKITRGVEQVEEKVLKEDQPIKLAGDLVTGQ